MDEPSMRRLAGLRNYGLSIVFGLLLLAALTGQAFTGMAGFNGRALDTGLPEVSIGAYLTSSEFAVDVAENWQSEYLQFFLYILLTVWLLQRGSPESKALDRAGRESDKDQLVGEYATADSPAWARASGWRRLTVLQLARTGHGLLLPPLLDRPVHRRT